MPDWRLKMRLISAPPRNKGRKMNALTTSGCGSTNSKKKGPNTINKTQSLAEKSVQQYEQIESLETRFPHKRSNS